MDSVDSIEEDPDWYFQGGDVAGFEMAGTSGFELLDW
jgi:hypothetical protein